MRSLLRLDNLDVTLARLGCVLSVPVSIYLYLEISLASATIGVITFSACLFYLIMRRRNPPSIWSHAKATPRLYLVLNLLFFGLLAYSLAAYLLRDETYVRPLGYFVATAGMAGILAVEILVLPPTRRAIGLALFKAIAISASLVWTQSLLFPSLVGVDPWYHQWLTTEIVFKGNIPVGNPYAMMPGMHVLIGGVSFITGLNYKMAALSSVSLIQIVCIPVFVFLIGKHLHGIKVGLFAALVLAVANWHIMFSYWIIPNGLAIAFIPIVVYLLMRLDRLNPVVGTGLVAAFAAAVIVTHTIAAVMLTMLLFFIWTGLMIYGRLMLEPVAGNRRSLIAALSVVGASVAFWTFVSGDMHILIKLVGVGFSAEAFRALTSGSGIPVGEQLFAYMGFFLFCGLSIIGCLVSFSKGMVSRHSFAFTLAVLAVLAFAFACFATRRFVVVGRWCYLLQVFLAIPLGLFFVWLSGRGRRALNICLVGLTVFALTFLMVVSPQANQDNRTFGPNTIIRHAFTELELEAINTVADMWEGDIAVDSGYYDMRHEFDGRLVDMSPELLSRNFSECDGMVVLVRNEIVNEPCKIGRYTPTRLGYDPREVLKEQGFVEIYDNGDVIGFAKGWYG